MVVAQVELKERGAEIPVTYANRKEFVELTVQKRLEESDKQVRPTYREGQRVEV